MRIFDRLEKLLAHPDSLKDKFDLIDAVDAPEEWKTEQRLGVLMRLDKLSEENVKHVLDAVEQVVLAGERRALRVVYVHLSHPSIHSFQNST